MPTLKPKPKRRVRRTSPTATAVMIEPSPSSIPEVSPQPYCDPEILYDFEEQLRLLASLDLPETDGVPLESSWHRECINLLIESVKDRFQDRSDFCVHGNLAVYYSIEQVSNRDLLLGPDFFFVHGAPHIKNPNRWASWEQGGRYPDVIIELLSPSTAKRDRTEKKEIYRKVFHTSEYFLYDPATQTLEGFRLVRHQYEPIECDSHGRLWSEELELWIGLWEGSYQGVEAVWLRFFDPKGRVVFVPAERERCRAEQEMSRAEQEKLRAEQEKSRAEGAELRASAAEAELARLKATLAKKKS
ncbi:MAG: Uma2 family endonuclease [Planctomycetaceae bacterium]